MGETFPTALNPEAGGRLYTYVDRRHGDMPIRVLGLCVWCPFLKCYNGSNSTAESSIEAEALEFTARYRQFLVATYYWTALGGLDDPHCDTSMAWCRVCRPSAAILLGLFAGSGGEDAMPHTKQKIITKRYW